MYLIIDSGATKTEYLLIDQKEVLFRFSNMGINASYTSDHEIRETLREFRASLPETGLYNPEYLFFYGAGCGKEENAARIKGLLTEFFSSSNLRVYPDLLAACHALCGEHPGWVAILGTGSSSCFYNGNEISHRAPSLGYLIGDEGSGTHLGKFFLTSYLSHALPQNITSIFEEHFQLTPAVVIERLYRHPAPNRFMASIAPFLKKHLTNPVITEICYTSFNDFFCKQKKFYTENNLDCSEISLLGSIAFHFEDIIREVAQEQHIAIKKIIAAPADLLADFYKNMSNPI